MKIMFWENNITSFLKDKIKKELKERKTKDYKGYTILMETMKIYKEEEN